MPQDTGIKAQSILELFSVKEMVVVVTGGARGLGLNFSNALAQAGADVAAIDISEHPHADFKQISQYGTRTKYYKSDVTNAQAIEATIQQIIKDFGKIDGCIPAAGIVREGAFIDTPVADVTAVINVNVLGVYFTLQSVIRQMVKQGSGGRIVNISSIAGHIANYKMQDSAYVTSKHAIRGLTKQLAHEYAEYNIRVNSISPGCMVTNMTESVLKNQPDLVKIWEKLAMLGRMGQANELNGAMIYLMSSASSYVTGEDILVDGGTTKM